MNLHTLASRALGFTLAALAVNPLLAQSPYPDRLYYKFDEGGGTTTANLASPGVGANPATVNGHALTPAGGQFGGALQSAGTSSTSYFVDSGWVTDLSGDFTISFWLDLTALTTSGPFMYVFGDNTAQTFRCFTNGAAGVDGITLRSSNWSSGVIVPGGGSTAAPHHIAFVYAHGAGELRGYLDGVRVATAPVNPAAHTGTANFKVGGYATVTAPLVGTRIDEFRLYGSALSDAEIAATWNVSLTQGPSAPVVYCTPTVTAGGCTPSIGWSGTPSATATSGFDIDVSGVDGQRQGLLFYGIDNTGFTPLPWGTGFFCVKAPTQRTSLQFSGGTLGGCDGSFALDWNAFQASTPGALGQPLTVGQSVYAQGWLRDPPSPKTTAFSDALEFTVTP